MNLVLLTGTVQAVLPGSTEQSVFLIETLEALPQRVLVRGAANAHLRQGMSVEVRGRLVDEAIAHDGKIVRAETGRELRHAVMVAVEIALRSELGATPSIPSAAPRPGALGSTQRSLTDGHERKEGTTHVQVPTLPWD